MSSYICPECNKKYPEYYWCKPLIEWIPFEKFKDVKQIGKGGFGTIHYARWIDGYIRKWDIENQQWKRYGNHEVELKKVDNFVNFNDVLNEMSIQLKIYYKYDASIRFLWNIQDPEIHSYMMVLEYAADGNLREYLKINFNNINWLQKLNNLWFLSLNLMRIHELDIVHQDFHPGNILSSSFKSDDIKISDFGLSKLIGANPNNSKKKEFFWINKFNNYNSSYYQAHPQAIYTSQLLNFSKLPKPKNEENFERELEELTKSTSALSIVASKLHVPDF
ncbi:hypothetical protein Glove_87g131 [Diversispora epigaea]|uniref:Protein kinase domain-containing protein n=1 Tax=Diversispora epigaea TaxID=1348612 RepID=A0A397JFZ1_9GLOM|nr:hypothetical protein Glove_87g131 [Diversispora epigaea]